MADTTPLHELTEEELATLCPRLWDGEAEYERLSKTRLPAPPGSTWASSNAIQVDFPFTFPAWRRQLLTTLLVKYKLYRQQCSACGVPPLAGHEDDEMIYVTQSTQIKRRKHERRLKGAPEDDPWSVYSEIEWENIRTPFPDGYHMRFVEFNEVADYPACTVEESNPDPPEGWSGDDLPELPDYDSYDWRITDEEDENTDDSIINYHDFVGACMGALKDQEQSRQLMRSFNLRKAYPLMSYTIPLQGWAGIEDLSARVLAGEAAVHQWTADLWATGQRIPFKIVYTERITWLYDNGEHETGEVYSESEKEIEFSHSSGWHHTLEPPTLVGRKTALMDAHIEFFRDGL